MSERSDIDGRPVKRARLDDATDTAALTSTDPATTSTELPKAPIASAPAAVDTDIEKEVRAGITKYVCPDNLGFKGVLKQRYTDFLVNEVGLDGKVLHLRVVGVENKSGGKKEIDEQNGEKAEAKQEETNEVNIGEAVEAAQKDVETKVEENGKTEETANGHEVSKSEKKEDQQPSAEDLATLHSIFGESTTSQIISLVQAIRRKEDKKAKDFKAVIAPPITDKEIRTEAHKSLRRIFPNLLESSMEEDQSIRIKAVPPRERKGKNKGRGGERSDNRGQGPDRRRGQLGWEELGGEFLHFTLYKENKDTMEVVGFLGSKLTTGAKAFSFAGTKDKRACTVQRVCVKRQTAERMNGFNQTLFNAAIGDFSYEKRDLRLGDLVGNEFTITLRDCQFQGDDGLEFGQRMRLADDIVSKAIVDFSERGFINYYGLQRFGSFAASTDTVGLKMLQGDLKGAVEDLLAYTDSALAASDGTGDASILVSQDDRSRAKALHIWKTTQKGGAALDILPRRCNAERNIIQHLSSRNSKSGRHDRLSDWQGALMCIPRNLRLMYVHAYQSLVWNVVAGKRWTTYGDKVVEGDLVLVNEHKGKEESAKSGPDQTIDQDGEIIINPEGADSALAADEQFERARHLSSKEAASGQYSIFDVVLPQPGFDVEYPKNDIGKFYKEFMGSERGGGLDPHNMRRSWREVSLSGGYRKFLARPLQPLDYSIKSYLKDEEQFVETDLDVLRKEGHGVTGGSHNRGARKEDKDGDVDMRASGDAQKKIAVVLKLQLGSSQYATMALRELMKAGGVKAYKSEYMGGR
ncbi:pseudouridine synthase-like protein TruD/Pus7 [Lentithecium fluviatile CBS 122367]|uniref:Pseudouridine synthase-like protein TruD/Pus7 n=1 Tax=Lentithecium fluviatile CBS 122367 TaxID=1168545 RepID=A0A6G1IIK4_9PLEO|nr:pseudouridine synthase-like protein TruD/Pus7 [Lentithecium fluviatile CBS 122367]